MEKKKKNLIIGFLLVGILVVILVFFAFKKNIFNNNANPNKDENINLNPNQGEKETEVSTFSISKFEVDKNVSGQVSLFFKLTNKSKEAIKDKYLDINMYDGKDLLYTYDYLIENLKVDEFIYVEATANFSYKNISKYEFVIDDIKVSLEPVYIDL